MRRLVLKLALAALVLADVTFIPFAAILVLVGGIDALIGVNGHPSGGGSRGSFLLGAALLAGGGIVTLVVLVWLTRRTIRALRRPA